MASQRKSEPEPRILFQLIGEDRFTGNEISVFLEEELSVNSDRHMCLLEWFFTYLPRINHTLSNGRTTCREYMMQVIRRSSYDDPPGFRIPSIPREEETQYDFYHFLDTSGRWLKMRIMVLGRPRRTAVGTIWTLRIFDYDKVARLR